MLAGDLLASRKAGEPALRLRDQVGTRAPSVSCARVAAQTPAPHAAAAVGTPTSTSTTNKSGGGTKKKKQAKPTTAAAASKTVVPTHPFFNTRVPTAGAATAASSGSDAAAQPSPSASLLPPSCVWPWRMQGRVLGAAQRGVTDLPRCSRGARCCVWCLGVGCAMRRHPTQGWLEHRTAGSDG